MKLVSTISFLAVAPSSLGQGTSSNSLSVTIASDQTPIFIAAQGAAMSDASSTITAGGTAQTALASNASRKYLLIQNVSAQALYFNIGSAATQTQGSVLIPANGGGFEYSGTFVPTGSISIIGATTGLGFTIKWA